MSGLAISGASSTESLRSSLEGGGGALSIAVAEVATGAGIVFVGAIVCAGQNFGLEG